MRAGARNRDGQKGGGDGKPEAQQEAIPPTKIPHAHLPPFWPRKKQVNKKENNAGITLKMGGGGGNPLDPDSLFLLPLRLRLAGAGELLLGQPCTGCHGALLEGGRPKSLARSAAPHAEVWSCFLKVLSWPVP